MTKPIYSGLGTILIFHRVCPRRKEPRISGNLRLEVTPEYLENVIRFLHRRDYEIISLDRLYDALPSQRINKKFVIFTFDDGYADNFTYAYPIFKKYNIPFTVYVTTNFPDRQAVLWWYILEDLILKNRRIVIKIGDNTLEFKFISDAEKENAFSRIRSVIMDKYVDTCPTELKKIFAFYNIDLFEKTDRLALSWEQIRQMNMDSLVTIGSHTVNHFALNKLSEAAVRYEIIESKNKLESHIDRNVEHFTYPFGTRDEVGKRELRIVKECGFKTATTAISGNIFPIHKNYLQCLPRIAISGEREGKNIQYLNLCVNGTIACLNNKFKRVVTL